MLATEDAKTWEEIEVSLTLFQLRKRWVITLLMTHELQIRDGLNFHCSDLKFSDIVSNTITIMNKILKVMQKLT